MRRTFAPLLLVCSLGSGWSVACDRSGGGGASGGTKRSAVPAAPAPGPHAAPRRRPTPAGAVDLRAPRWPAGFVVTRTLRVEAAERDVIGRRLGGRLTALTNYWLSAGAARLRVNVLVAASDGDAARVHETFARGGFDARLRVARQGLVVLEIVTEDALARHRLKLGLGLLDRTPRRYRVTARYGLLARGSAADVNELFNLVLRPRPQAAAWQAALGRLRGKLTFGQTLWLRRAPTAGGPATYRLAPAPTTSKPAGAATVHTFTGARRLHGVPYVDLVAEVPTVGWTPIPAPRAPGRALTASTKAWPADAPAVRRRVRALVAGRETALDKLRALHGWVVKNVTYGGRQGSRDGVLAVLRRGFGRCGDMADVLVTFARAAGLPARLVAGWLVGGPGHFWTEVHLPGRGWVGVDATVPWLGVSGDYVPLQASTDGHLPVLHLRIPKIERLR